MMEIPMKRSVVVIFIIIGVVILANCQKLNPTPIQATITISSQTTQVITNQPSLTATLSPRPSLYPSKTVTPTIYTIPTREFTLTPMPTWTQLPTLSDEEAEESITDLLQNNAGCKLPCWWGITPGETTWNEAKQFLETFTNIEGPSLQEIDNVLYMAYSAWFQFGEKDYYVYFLTVNDTIVEIGSGPDVTVYGHQLNQLLTNNGEPDQIWIAPMPETPGGPWFYLVLYYPDQGILARYGGEANLLIKTDKDGKAIITGINICPVGMGPELWLESPNTLRGVYGNPALGGTAFTSLLRSIEVTGMNVTDFYNLFRSADSITCFDVPQ